MRYPILVAVLMMVGASAARAQNACIQIRIEFANGTSRNINTPEGPHTAGVSIKGGDEFRSFYLDLTVHDRAAGTVHVVIRDGRELWSPVLEEFLLQTDDPTRQTSTMPSFGLALLGIEGRMQNSALYRCPPIPTSARAMLRW